MADKMTYAGVGVDYEVMDPFKRLAQRAGRETANAQEHGPVDDQEAYANFNMGAGFALYVRESDVAKLLSIAHSLGLSALRAGTIASSKIKKVIINPLGLEYLGSTLGVR